MAYADAPAMQVAHRSHVIAMTDAAALRALVEAERPHLIVPEIEAIATDELARIEADGLATVIPTARAAQLTMNREGIRRLAAEELGLPTSAYAFASTEAELAAGAQAVGFPCFVKPVMSSSGKGQSYVEGAEGIADAWRYALEGGRVEQPRVIVEGRVEFDFEITQLTVRSVNGGEVAIGFCEPIGHRQVKGDQVWFSEVSPRPHDTGLVTLVSQYQSEFAIHARAILGLPVDVSLREPGASAVIYGGLEAKGIAFEGVAEALSVPGADLRLFGKPESFTRRRMGVALACGGDVHEARARVGEAAAKVRPVVG